MDIRVFVIALILISSVGIVARMFRFPPSPLLVLTGTLLAAWIVFPALHFDPNFLLTVLLPPLLFEGSLKLSFSELKKTGWGIFFLACPGVLLSVFLLGPLFHIVLAIPLLTAFLFASLLAATDPVAVLDAFRNVRISRTLSTLIEGESLFNDGTAMVLFGIFLGISRSIPSNMGSEIWHFITMTVGGIGIGAVLGFLINYVSRIRFEQELRISLSTVLAYGAYLLADSLHVSGILAVVSAGIVYANVFPHYPKKDINQPLWDFWSYVGFLTTSVIFLLIGTQVNSREILGYWKPALLTYGLLMAVRFVIVLMAFFFSSRTGQKFSWSWLLLTWWGGLRGALSLALAMSLIGAVPEGRSLFFITLTLVIFFLFINGLSANPWIRRLKLKESS